MERQTRQTLPRSRPRNAAGARPSARGKFFWVGDEKLYIRGVTYGTFRPDECGNQYHNLRLIDRDFAAMAESGINTVRVYNTPPHALLDIAERHQLRVLVDLAADQYVGYLTDRNGAPDIRLTVRAKVRALAGRRPVFGYSLGNEISATLVRWHGRRVIQRYLRRLYNDVKAEDPEALVTYVNYPSTEYLHLPFLDFCTFNVYLESLPRFAAYLARLQNLAGDVPLVMGEIGLDSCRHGEETQARLLDQQIRTAFAGGCAGVFVYSWTDEWYRGGADAEDWAFGITRRDRSAKPAMATVEAAFREAPLPAEVDPLAISVVVCTHNGAKTIRDCCEGLQKLDYHNFEVIVVDDGSTDGSADIAQAYGFRVIRTANRGLSRARNTGLHAATGDIAAYIDDDAYPDPQWLSYLSSAFAHSGHAAIGGPNIAPPGSGAIAECIANSPGGPVHVLVSDLEAEHIPGCNMAFRRSELEAIGGFDPRFRVAGDDVDVCWRLTDSGRSIGFCPAAMVWHRRRGSVRAYLKQQAGYGKAEAMLEAKWPERYNGVGHVSWAGRVYGNGHAHRAQSRGRIYQGTWGCAPFQSIYQPARGTWSTLPLMPEWHLLLPILAAVSALGSLWRPLVLARALLLVALAIPLGQSAMHAAATRFVGTGRSAITVAAMRVLTAALHILQPAARLYGRLPYGLSPWRQHIVSPFAVPRPWTCALWFECWRAPQERLQELEATLRAAGACVLRGGDFDRWDLEVRSSIFGSARLLMAVEEHGLGRQLVRFRVWPRLSGAALGWAVLLVLLTTAAARGQAWAAATSFAVVALVVAARIIRECGSATAALIFPLQAEQRSACPVTGDVPRDEPSIATTPAVGG